jgi:hypothetical protein
VDRVTRPGAGNSESSAPHEKQPEARVEPVDAAAKAATPGVPRGEQGRGEQGRGEQGRGGRFRRAGLAAISASPRLPIWERRIAIALVAGIAVTFIFDWRIGLTVAVLAAIADTIQRSRTTAAMPPARRGAAQRKTERKLHKLARSGYLTLNERAIPGSENIIDHLVVGPTGVFAIDSERWDKRMPVRMPGSKQQLFHGPFSQKERVAEARWEAARAAELIGGALGEQIAVRPAIAIYGPKIPWHVLTVRNVDVFDANRLPRYLRRGIKDGRGSPLTAAHAMRIHEAAVHVLPERF